MKPYIDYVSALQAAAVEIYLDTVKLLLDGGDASILRAAVT
jgi:hypothetical protein